MQAIKKIQIKNIKGKDHFELCFDDLHPNMVNILVAPNGFGKSTITKAFSCLRQRKLELGRNDYYDNDPNNEAELIVTTIGENANTYHADSARNELSADYNVLVINSSVIAKSSYNTAGADLKIPNITIFNKIPSKLDLNYKRNTIASELGCEAKILNNIDYLLNDYTVFHMIDESALKKCISQVSVENKIRSFLSGISCRKTARETKGNITENSINNLLRNRYINSVYCSISNHTTQKSLEKIDIVLNTIQLIVTFSIRYKAGDTSVLKKHIDYIRYRYYRALIDERLALFNTTNREIKTKKVDEQLVIEFVKADNMSNGERDVLTFISKISVFELNFDKPSGIIIFDEVFDYLDGANLLAVQYYLAQFINTCRQEGKTIYPILFTHLDPSHFNNYYFKKMKVHYLLHSDTSSYDSEMTKLVLLREDSSLSESANKYISKELLHYVDYDSQIPNEISSKLNPNFPNNRIDFINNLYIEVKDKYLKNQNYDVLSVAVAIRIRVEELAFSLLDTDDDKQGFIDTYKTKSKLKYVEEKGKEIPELLFLLQPLYNESLHLSLNPRVTKNKIDSVSL